MNIIVSKEKLLKAIQLADDIVTSKNLMPILLNLLLDVQDNYLYVTSTDLDNVIKIQVPVQMKEPGKILVNAKKFVEIIQELPNEDIALVVEDTMVKIESQAKNIKSEFKMKGITAEDYPHLNDLMATETLQIPQVVLKNMIQKTIMATANNENAGLLSGINIELKQKQLRMVATDARRLAMIDEMVQSDLNFDAIVVPTKILCELLKILSNEGDVEIKVDQKKIGFLLNGIELQAKLFDGQYPDYRQVIPKTLANQIILPTKKIYGAVKRVAVMAHEQDNLRIIFKFSDSCLEMMSEGDIGDAKDIIDVDYHGEEFQIAFSSSYLLDGLKTLNTETFVMFWNNNVSAVLFREADNTNIIYLVMPLRIN